MKRFAVIMLMVLFSLSFSLSADAESPGDHSVMLTVSRALGL